MKKFVTCAFMFLAIICLSECVNAAYIDGTNMIADIKIIWNDYENGLGIRPESIDIPFKDSTDLSNNQVITLNAADCDVESLGDGIKTTWKGTVSLPTTNSARDWPRYTLGVDQDDMFATDYRCISSSGYANYSSFGDPEAEEFVLEIWPEVSFNPTYTFKVVYNDGNNRDRNRTAIAHYVLVKNGVIDVSSPISFESDNTATLVLPAYDNDETGKPDISSPIEYSIESVNKDMVFDGKTYDFIVDQNGLFITLYASYEPRTLENDIPVLIDFGSDTHQKPNSLSVKLKTSKAEYNSINLTNDNNYNSKFQNAYVNDIDGNSAQYTVEIANTSDWEFNVTGNQEDGFVIKANYIGNTDTPEENGDDENDSENGSENVDEPKEKIRPSDIHTGGNPYNIEIIKYFVLGGLITYILIILKIRKRK